ncbi:MAG TPA: DUF177 domain-containing protein [Candidatus Eisenbacteria bacterium]|jgi:uncharacterized protein
MSGFSIDLASLSAGSHRLGLTCDAAELGLPQADWPGPVRGDFDVERSGDQVRVRGRLESVALLECVRCLKTFELPITPPFDLYAERAGTGRRPDEEALERDEYMKFHDGRKLELGAAAREALLLEIPMAPHCRDDCRGLCPVCGADRNELPCPHS